MIQRIVIICLLAFCCLPAQAQPPVLVPQVLNTYPHDPGAFTQGLLWHGGALYESTGLRGRSSLRRVDIETGLPEVNLPLDDAYFAEGLERVGDRLIQLTWQSGLAFVYDFPSLELIETIEYVGEGWGLCSDGRFLFMSDGSPYLSLRDQDSFELIFRGAVTLDGQLIPSQLLNELECVDEQIYANAWNTDYIFRIDKFTGNIIALIDASALLTDAERASLSPGSVLNGIAYNPESQTFYITGKNWPKLFEVVFVAQEDG
ncbi:MAG: glutaminyl-peptide cyclotransferase [Chloroflexi bacterium]|nr:glutaminyl-peptide cyclotransferase [Chloroflexota bacterium]